mmetsp:Transcript_82524/g.191750  ORF Transcript_82524/g.191750 Transcript_82524/m.191750 type:complete len:296 (+) Transcript_82524:94-981(+)
MRCGLRKLPRKRRISQRHLWRPLGEGLQAQRPCEGHQRRGRAGCVSQPGQQSNKSAGLQEEPEAKDRDQRQRLWLPPRRAEQELSRGSRPGICLDRVPDVSRLGLLPLVIQRGTAARVIPCPPLDLPVDPRSHAQDGADAHTHGMLVEDYVGAAPHETVPSILSCLRVAQAQDGHEKVHHRQPHDKTHEDNEQADDVVVIQPAGQSLREFPVIDAAKGRKRQVLKLTDIQVPKHHKAVDQHEGIKEAGVYAQGEVEVHRTNQVNTQDEAKGHHVPHGRGNGQNVQAHAPKLPQEG